MSRTPEEIFEAYLEEARTTPFSGWDFEHITRTRRMVEAPLSWNYYNVVLPWLSGASTMLDMGTGGGEVLSRFQPLPAHTCATEQYAPNIPLARQRLEPLGVKVIEVAAEDNANNQNLPFDDESFDLVINRHEAYFPDEVMRILKPGGTFITQQVGSITLLNLRQFLTGKDEVATNWNLEYAVGQLESAGFRVVERQEDIQFYRFYDIGAVAFLLKAIPWIIEDFSIDRYRDRLWELHLRICSGGFYDAPMHRFLVVVQKGEQG